MLLRFGFFSILKEFGKLHGFKRTSPPIDILRFINPADCRDKAQVSEAIRLLLQVIKEGYSTNYTWYESDSVQFFRGCISDADQRFEHIRDLWYPPQGLARANRAPTRDRTA